MPNSGRHDAGTTASEFDGAFDEIDNKTEGAEEDNFVDDKVDEEASVSGRGNQKYTKKVRRLINNSSP